MDIDRMRFVDRWIGTPLCALLSLFGVVQRKIRGFHPLPNPEKVLFVELSEMGSMILAYPLFTKMRDLYPGAEMYFLTFRENRYAIDILNVIPEENVLTITPRSAFSFVSSTAAAIRRIRSLGIDTVIDMESFARFTAILSFLSGAKIRVGFHRYNSEGLYRGNLQTHNVSYNPHIHMAQNFLNLAYALVSPREEIPPSKRSIKEDPTGIPEFEASEATRRQILEKLMREDPAIGDAARIVLLNPNAGDIIPLRRWPLTHYITLAELLLEHPRIHLVITGVASERAEAEKIRCSVGSDRCHNLAGRTSFKELLNLYDIAHLLITNDSGPAHFAGLTGIPTLIFFGPETPRLFGPLTPNSHILYSGYACSPCVSAFNHRRSACSDNVCLKDISPRSVYLKALGLLGIEPADPGEKIP